MHSVDSQIREDATRPANHARTDSMRTHTRDNDVDCTSSNDRGLRSIGSVHTEAGISYKYDARQQVRGSDMQSRGKYRLYVSDMPSST